MCTSQCIIEKLGGLACDEAIKSVKYVLHYRKNLGEVQAKMRDLVDRMENIEREVGEAKARGEKIEKHVLHWQQYADKLKNDIERLIEESTTNAKMRCIACSCPNIMWWYKLSKQAEDKIGNADKLIEKNDKFKEISHPRLRPSGLESLSDKKYYVNFDSRASIFKGIMDALKDSNISMIGVFGLGGVGKTTLVKEVGEQMRKDGTFDQVAIAVISKDLNVKEVQSRLAGSLNFKFKAMADDQEGRGKSKCSIFSHLFPQLKFSKDAEIPIDETIVKIHDVIRYVGISIAREEEAFLVDHGALRWPRNPTNGPSYKAMSLNLKNIKGLPGGLVYPQLRTLTVDNTELSDLEVPDNFFNGMTQLVVLTFTRMRMRRLPSSLAKLTNLQMLYLNRCKLADIAIIKDLKSNLEVLSLRGSSIKALPPEIEQLTSLRLLDLQDCDELMVIPRGVISNLTSLEEVHFPKGFEKWEAKIDEQQDTRSRDNSSLEELRGSLANGQLTTLHIHVSDIKLLPKEDLNIC
ncbi:hypothetical protein RHGRI_011870 [Rhododendron griersonianum]|uniref:NB-ARC domain-containing protein n=1 Tax=Rhododendron griersonianum TaxID=479676 RepID=A0AAV6KNE2_9ERIC|nr:hypothetical protein RHGRI_011870 [Rhododendron griersonianum]